MAMYVYATDGEALGFLYESFVFDLEGTPLGRVVGSRVHRLDGSYAGEWFHEMVVDRRSVPARALFPMMPPGRPSIPARPAPRRPVAEYRAYPDAFHSLYLADELLQHAAE